MKAQLQQVVRRLKRSPTFAAMTLITLATGIGATTAIFSVVNGVLLKPLPYPSAESLVGVWHTAPGIGFDTLNMSPASYYTYRDEQRSFEDIGMWSGGSVTITGTAEPEQIRSLWVTDATLPLLGVHPARGRWFSPKDDASKSPETAMLSYDYWQTRFGGDPGAIGRRLLVNGVAREIIGIMPENFRFLDFKPAVILPLQLNRSEVFIGQFNYQAIARLKPGTTIAQANADIARMLPMMAQKFSPPAGMSLKMFEEARLGPKVRPLKVDVIGDIGRVLWVLMATVGIVLFIACANVANLLLVRAEGRQQELAVRAALGASRGRIARELLFETMVLGVAGGVLGLGVAYAALRLLVVLSPANLPRLDEISIDPMVVVFTIAISLIAGLLFGLVPVLKYSGPRLNTALRSGSRTFSESRERHWTRSTLVVVQVSLAMVLLIGSGLMIRTLYGLGQVQPGFKDPEQLLTFRVSVPNAQVKEPERVARMFNDFVDKLAALPGVTSVALTNSVTMDGSNNNDPIFVEERPGSDHQLPPMRRYKHVAPGFFQTMGNPLLAGRDFTWTDIHEMRPVVVVSEALSREYWSSPAAALGKRIRENPKGTWREIIGVVGNERDNGVHEKAPAITYWPMLKRDFWRTGTDVNRNLAVVVRSNRTGSDNFFKDVRQAIWSVNASVPLANVRTVKVIYDRSLARTSFLFVMLTIAAGMALLLGIVGIYGVISYSISQRTREIGIRIALGAQQDKVRGMFVRHGMMLAGIGVACGFAAALALTRMIKAMLYEVSPVDPVTYAAVCLVLVLAASLAAYVPALRATRVDPVEALRAE
jgi:putative ABC transport system permease protein